MLRIASHFQRWDVDEWLGEIPHDQLEEWKAFFALEPCGWEAMRMTATRLSYASLLPHTGRKKLRERDLVIRTVADAEAVNGPNVERAQFEAFSIRTTIAAGETVDG